MRSSAEAICSRMARTGRSKPAMRVMVSMRASVSRGLLEWIGGDRAVVAGVHGLEHVEGLAAAALADDDAVGAHAQAFLTRSRMVTSPRPSMFGGRASMREHVVLVELELLGVLDGDDALVGRG